MKLSNIRTFQPLEEWIYLKIYINPISSNLVLTRYLFPIINEIYPTETPKWFFLRYRDTSYHIRLRFWFPNSSKVFKGFKIIRSYIEKGMKDGLISKWIIDGYEREIERYGEKNIEVTESYFCINSDFIAHSIRHISHNDYTLNCLVLSMMHLTISTFLPDLEDRLSFCKNNMQNLYKEYRVAESSIKTFNNFYRRYRNFTDLLGNDKFYNLFPQNTITSLKEYKHKLISIANIFRSYMENTINLSSMIHLDINRAYEIDARKIEMVLYYILYKTYIAESYRKTKNN